MIEFMEDKTGYFGNIKAYDMYVDGERVYTWLCYYINDKAWRFKGASLIDSFPLRATRKEVETDALAWWAAKQLEEMK